VTRQNAGCWDIAKHLNEGLVFDLAAAFGMSVRSMADAGISAQKDGKEGEDRRDLGKGQIWSYKSMRNIPKCDGQWRPWHQPYQIASHKAVVLRMV